jgi:hypothetical protein
VWLVTVISASIPEAMLTEKYPGWAMVEPAIRRVALSWRENWHFPYIVSWTRGEWKNWEISK